MRFLWEPAKEAHRIMESRLFPDWVKYPRTYHLPWSDGVGKSDRVLSSISIFEGKEVVVTEKMDGENTSLYNDYIHARSLDSAGNATRAWVKGFWATIRQDIPKGWRVCGENLYAKHSIKYENLNSYFLGFSIWDSNNYCLDWDTTQDWFNLLGIKAVPVLYRGIFNERSIKDLYNPQDYESKEGYVIRVSGRFHYREFNKSVAKYVRKDHVKTSKHWVKESVTINGLKTKNPSKD